jgi:hypothetical protein
MKGLATEYAEITEKAAGVILDACLIRQVNTNAMDICAHYVISVYSVA